MPKERVQKILARAGITSRRKAEALILEGVVTVNGRLARLGEQADFEKDAIKVRGKLIHTKQAPVYIAFHKPRGVISMMADPESRPTLAPYFEKLRTRVFPIGRLDFNSEGLLLLTNDGLFAEAVQKNSTLSRTYEVKVKGHVDTEKLARLKRGGREGGRQLRPVSVRLTDKLASKSKIELVIAEPGTPDLKAFFETRGYFVERLIRKGIGPVTLKALPLGHFRFLTKGEMRALRGLTSEAQTA